MKEVKVLLYGTLRRGGALHDVVEPFEISKPIEITGIKMFETRFEFPGAIITNNKKDRIIGEIATVPKKFLKYLDFIEGCYHKPPLYKRETMKINGENVYVYELNDRKILTDKIVVDWIKEGK